MLKPRKCDVSTQGISILRADVENTDVEDEEVRWEMNGLGDLSAQNRYLYGWMSPQNMEKKKNSQRAAKGDMGVGSHTGESVIYFSRVVANEGV